MLGWIYLLLGIVLETVATTFIKLSEGFIHLWLSLWGFVFYGISFFVMLPLAYRTIEASVAYSVWAGLGAVFVTLVGVLCMHESITLLQWVGMAIVIIGVISLKLNTTPLTEEKSQE